MRKVKLAFGLLAGILVTSAVLADDAIETLWLDTYSPQGVEFIEVQSSTILREGVSYLIKVEGTFSVWSPYAWQNMCGNPNETPQYPSPNTQNGRVGFDIANVFAVVSGSSLCGGTFPVQRGFPVSLDNGNEWLFLVPENSEYNSDHLYTYRIVGQGNVFQTRFGDSYMQMDNYGQLKIQIYPEPTCQLYGVHDEKRNDSQLFTISPETFEVKALGDVKKAHDIEALDTHPQTGDLLAASGKDTKKPGHLYRVDKNSGQLTDIGSTGFKEIDGLSFHPDGTLWGWASGDGLVTIDTTTGQAKLVAAYPGEIEDLTWNTTGTILFGVENLRNNPDAGVKLLAYDGNTVETVCEELTQLLEIEALDTLSDDTLIFGIHGKTNLPLGVIDVANCQIIAKTEIATDYNDVEGISWPKKSCATQTIAK